MNFLDDIRNFCQNKLKPVSSLVQTPDGKNLLESRDEITGQRVTRLIGQGGPGFVRDLRPDHQVATVIPGLSLGSQDVSYEFGLLKRHCITHILNVGTGIANSFESSFTYKRVDILDLPDVDISAAFDHCFLFIDSALEKDATDTSESDGDKPVRRNHVFVHCNAGISRSATIVLAYLMSRRNLCYADALKLVRVVRPSIRPNDGFHLQLQELDRKLSGVEN